MNSKSPDSKAVEKTKYRLRAALVELLKTKTLDKISVSELTEKSYLSRGTFYLHYANTEEFFSDTREIVFHRFAAQLIKFLEDGIDKAKDNCRAENLVIAEADRALLGLYAQKLPDWTYLNKILYILSDDFYAYASETCGKEYFEKNKTLFRMFWYGYSYSMLRAFDCFEADKFYSNLIKNFVVRDCLFPDAD